MKFKNTIVILYTINNMHIKLTRPLIYKINVFDFNIPMRTHTI